MTDRGSAGRGEPCACPAGTYDFPNAVHEPYCPLAGQGETQTFKVDLPAEAIELLYEVLGHFPHTPGSWSNLARAKCSIALWDVRHARTAAPGVQSVLSSEASGEGNESVPGAADQ